MPSVVCPSCRRHCRVRQQSLGREVVCTHCAARFVAGETEPAQPTQEPLSYGPDSSGALPGVAWLILLVILAALAVWLLARG